MRIWRWLNRLAWYQRWPMKFAILLVTCAAVAFPYPGVTWRHLQHARDPDRLIQPEAPALQPLFESLQGELTPTDDAQTHLEKVQRFVVQHIPYRFDWQVWGVADYLPTVAEVIQRGTEDCDGRAVIAASLLRKLGYDARLVANSAHVWVWTPEGETMHPQSARIVTATDDGMRVDWRGLTVIPKSLGYGLAVFPLVRELIVVCVFWLLLLGPGTGNRRAFICGAALVAALLIGRYSGQSWEQPILAGQLLALALLVSAFIMAHGVGQDSSATNRTSTT